ncbi:unnamed protein product [Amoebophrya sp. A120]|nr:unnamed protein product [Amoebophrya sp. A120]|eukprot:GSA120T00021471001.1
MSAQDSHEITINGARLHDAMAADSKKDEEGRQPQQIQPQSQPKTEIQQGAATLSTSDERHTDISERPLQVQQTRTDQEDEPANTGKNDPAPPSATSSSTCTGAAAPSKNKRQICGKCDRPQTVCLCPWLPEQKLKIPSFTKIIVLQHPQEQKQKHKTDYFLSKCLDRIEIVKGRRWSDELKRKLRVDPEKTLLLFPSKEALTVKEVFEDQDESIRRAENASKGTSPDEVIRAVRRAKMGLRSSSCEDETENPEVTPTADISELPGQILWLSPRDKKTMKLKRKENREEIKAKHQVFAHNFQHETTSNKQIQRAGAPAADEKLTTTQQQARTPAASSTAASSPNETGRSSPRMLDGEDSESWYENLSPPNDVKGKYYRYLVVLDATWKYAEEMEVSFPKKILRVTLASDREGMTAVPLPAPAFLVRKPEILKMKKPGCAGGGAAPTAVNVLQATASTSSSSSSTVGTSCTTSHDFNSSPPPIILGHSTAEALALFLDKWNDEISKRIRQPSFVKRGETSKVTAYNTVIRPLRQYVKFQQQFTGDNVKHRTDRPGYIEGLYEVDRTRSTKHSVPLENENKETRGNEIMNDTTAAMANDGGGLCHNRRSRSRSPRRRATEAKNDGEKNEQEVAPTADKLFPQ